MFRKKSLAAGLLMLLKVGIMVTAPLIQKISNQSDFGFVILRHSDVSSCSLHGKNIVVDAHAVFNQTFLLEIGQPSLILRPIYFLDTQTNQKFFLTDEHYEYIPEKVQIAYQAWKKSMKLQKVQLSDVWLQKWVGQDLIVIPHKVAIFGYLNNWSRVIVRNNVNMHNEWIKFAKGIFSKEILELDIEQSKHKGLFGYIQTLHGEGGVCIEGAIERI